MKAACDKADLKSAVLGPGHVDVPEELTAADLALLPEKERNKIINQMTRDAKKAMDKAEREAIAAIDKRLRKQRN